METQKFDITSSQSNITWVGKKVTGAHDGTIDLKRGEIVVSDNKLIKGFFIVDTTSIKILDITDPETNAQFAGHLASDDFFSSQQFPEAVLEIISVSDNHVEGNLTIKGITNRIAFDTIVRVENGVLRADARIIIDRTKYDMKFRSGNFFTNLGDTLIYNDFELQVTIIASLRQEILSLV
ncbi:YceI family protein [Pseudochryseolinea flava]|uniref:YceI family protein n=1 Tax=Pseudochryseolinea flava TaxID=2059302 RepID=A0A364Y1C6_9BACT|nr:YceI family protein [Pseudochryseolinea flava]RAW00401.1 YceI family protein [Pseudochryseolinea flava]